MPFQRITLLHMLAGLLLLMSSRAAEAWGPDGHRIVGAIAEARLEPQARRAVADLLADEPEPSLAGVANWADVIRPEEAWHYTGPWHYVNLPDLECHYQAPRDCPDGNCVIGAIERQLQVLTDRAAPRQQRIEALKFVAHFVGDVHQPLHAGLRTDRGGNDFAVRFGDEDWNLHSVWDGLILHAPVTADGGWQQTATRLSADRPAIAEDDDAEHWAEESCALIRSADVYPRRHRIGRIYLERQRPIVEARLRLAGERLAAALNRALSDTP